LQGLARSVRIRVANFPGEHIVDRIFMVVIFRIPTRLLLQGGVIYGHSSVEAAGTGPTDDVFLIARIPGVSRSP
jgi:hypothetical protein